MSPPRSTKVDVEAQPSDNALPKKRRNSVDKNMAMLGTEARMAAEISGKIGETNERALMAAEMENLGATPMRASTIKALERQGSAIYANNKKGDAWHTEVKQSSSSCCIIS